MADRLASSDRVLVDTDVWIDHLRRSEPALVELLEQGRVAAHPTVIGELALGTLRDRAPFLASLHRLPHLDPARDGEVGRLVEAHRLWERGLSLVDSVSSCWRRSTGSAMATGRGLGAGRCRDHRTGGPPGVPQRAVHQLDPLRQGRPGV